MQQVGESLREAQAQVAQAGQPEGAQIARGAGTNGEAQSGSQRGGRQVGGGRSGRGMGAAAGGAEAGRGTTNAQQRGGAMGANTPKNRQSPDRPRTEARFEQVYAPERLATRNLETQVKGKHGEGAFDTSLVRGAPERGSAAQPYYEVYSTYRRAAEDALNREEVPATYKKQVRDYFDSLQPAGE